MKTLTVALPGRSYDILIERGLLAQAGAHCRKVLPRAERLFVVTDSNVGPLYLDRVRAGLEGAGFQVTAHTVPAGEGAKCAGRLSELWEAMMAAGLTRTDAVVALGGGVVGDLAGPPCSPRWTPPWGARLPSTSTTARTWPGRFGSPNWCSWIPTPWIPWTTRPSPTAWPRW